MAPLRCAHCGATMLRGEYWDDTPVVHCVLCGWVKYLKLPCEYQPDVPAELRHRVDPEVKALREGQRQQRRKLEVLEARERFGAACLEVIKDRWKTYKAFSDATGIPASSVRLVCVGRMGVGAMVRVGMALGVSLEGVVKVKDVA